MKEIRKEGKEFRLQTLSLEGERICFIEVNERSKQLDPVQ